MWSVSGLGATAKAVRNLLTPLPSILEDALNDELIEFNPFDVDHAIQTEHMALVYARVMQEAGVKV